MSVVWRFALQPWRVVREGLQEEAATGGRQSRGKRCPEGADRKNYTSGSKGESRWDQVAQTRLKANNRTGRHSQDGPRRGEGQGGKTSFRNTSDRPGEVAECTAVALAYPRPWVDPVLQERQMCHSEWQPVYQSGKKDPRLSKAGQVPSSRCTAVWEWGRAQSS